MRKGQRILRLSALIMVTALVAAVAAVGWLWWFYRETLEAPLAHLTTPLDVEIPRGASVRAVARLLEREGVFAHPWMLIVEARRRDFATRIQAGEYQLRPGETPQDILARFVAGDTKRYRITLIEGQTFAAALNHIRAHPKIAAVDLADGALDDPARLVEIYGLPFAHPEGSLYPDTYEFSKGASDADIVARARDRLLRELGEAWTQRAEGLPFGSPYEALILASIVEKETAVPAERPRIAGVFVRRLERGMKLQTDPTVIYGLGRNFDGDLRRRDLTRDTPYNTYTRGGLPPTPIALVGRAALDAALAPADGEALYFVARGDGTHAFSATYAEHRRAVRRYQLGGAR